MKKIILVLSAGLLFIGANVFAHAEDNWCNDLSGAAYGLCNAYCKAMDCTNDIPYASDSACDKVYNKFLQLEGQSPPCETEGYGVPSATHFSLAASWLNIPGFVLLGLTSDIYAFIGDRFGNFNALEGTSVSFYTEAGTIDTISTLDATGQTTVTLRTQAPMPENVSIASWETTNINALNTTFITAFPSDNSGGHPRDGWVTVLATVHGEETFNDTNGNGEYDLGETFTDLGEPFYDKNDNGIRDDGTGVDPFEEFIDDDGDSTYDGPNGVWDGPDCPAVGCQNSRIIWTDLTVQFTGNATTCIIDPPTRGVAVADGRSRVLNFMVSDFNLNSPIGGTTITVTHSGGGKLFGQTDYTIPDHVSSGPYQIAVTVADDDPGDVNPPELFSVEFEVSSSEIVTCVNQIATGTID